MVARTTATGCTSPDPVSRHATHQSWKAHEMTVERVVDAWVIQGPQPGYHEHMKNLLRNQWPALAQALDELAQEEGRQ